MVKIDPFFDPFSDENLIDKEWYPNFINQKERERLREQSKCEHTKWVKKCTCCGAILETEHTHKSSDLPPLIEVHFQETTIITENKMV